MAATWKIITIGVASFFGTLSIAHAGFYLEPGLTYESGEHTINWGAPFSSSTGSTSGAGFNLKGGWAIVDTVFFGADVSLSKPGFKNSASGNNYDVSANSNLLGVMVGGQIPIIGIRAWGGYIFDGTLDPDASNGVDAKFSGANGLKLGAGIHFLVVSVNLEYSDLQYNTSTVQSTGPINFTQDFTDKMKNKLWTVSVSFPIML